MQEVSQSLLSHCNVHNPIYMSEWTLFMCFRAPSSRPWMGKCKLGCLLLYYACFLASCTWWWESGGEGKGREEMGGGDFSPLHHTFHYSLFKAPVSASWCNVGGETSADGLIFSNCEYLNIDTWTHVQSANHVEAEQMMQKQVKSFCYLKIAGEAKCDLSGFNCGIVVIEQQAKKKKHLGILAQNASCIRETDG